MKLLLKRLHHTENSTIGELFIDGKFECYVLEDVERQEKVFGKTAIPKGTYNVIMTLSNRFKVVLPLLENVPNYTGVRIHSGNTAKDTEGCLILGQTRSIDFVGNSKKALANFLPKIKDKKVTLTIE
tara:strand:+ start:99 stop:479 length:381 start_codon:yes stop_codon:yes gene_type:complete